MPASRSKKKTILLSATDPSELHEFVVEYRRYKTQLNEKYLKRKTWVPKDKTRVLSFIPGTVNSVLVKEGDKVMSGAELLILEAMKMKNKVLSECSGTIKKIHVSAGDRVPKSKLLMELDPD